MVVACIPLFFVSTAGAQVRQEIGKPDIEFGGLVETDCEVCHYNTSINGGGVDGHHNLYGTGPIDTTITPYDNADGVDPDPDAEYSCLSCHSDSFNVPRDCTVCHGLGNTPHHGGSAAMAGNCTSCHGGVIVDLDTVPVPTYDPSLVTPSREGGAGTGGTGSCVYCHVGDGTGTPDAILSNVELHHGTGLNDGGNCVWCHIAPMATNTGIRQCETCHSLGTLHNIQDDSPGGLIPGTVVVGGEDATYGHIGADADCWGCHGNYVPTGAGFAPLSGATVPTITKASSTNIKGGTDTLVVLTGSSFTNITNGVVFESDAVLTAADGSSVTLARGPIVEAGILVVTIPADTAPGNYKLRAVKHHLPTEGTDDPGEAVPSNPVAIAVVPQVNIAGVTSSDGILIIEGSGFAGCAEGAGTVVTGRIGGVAVEAVIVSWSDTEIKADFGGESPAVVTVNSVFGICDFRIGE